MDVAIRHDRLWSDHFYLLREVVKDIVYDIPSLEADKGALYVNAYNLALTFSLLSHDPSITEPLKSLLSDHVSTAVKIVNALIQGDSIYKLVLQWQDNASGIGAAYQSEGIDEDEIQYMLLLHLNTTLDEMTAIIERRHQESILKGEVALDQIHKMSSFINSYFTE